MKRRLCLAAVVLLLTALAVPVARATGVDLSPGSDNDHEFEVRLPPDCLIAQDVGCNSPNLTPVANIRYAPGTEWSEGSDLELAEIGGRRYAITGAYTYGMHVIDVTTPAQPQVVAVMGCAVAQGDVQILRRDDRTFVVYAVDDYSTNDNRTACFSNAGYRGTASAGFVVVDLTDPTQPDPISFTPFARGSHNTSLHPSGRWLYNSNADLAGAGQLEVFDLADLTQPTLVRILPLGLGLSSHDVTFNADGTRAYTAALTHSLVLDTTRPDNPKILSTILDPVINLHHQADPVTLPDGHGGTRTFLLVSDELAGAEPAYLCPGGAIHVFDITGPLERLPLKVGLFEIPDIRRTASADGTCTSHVFRVYPEQGIMTIAWYAAGTRVVDISGLAGISVGVHPALDVASFGMREIGYAWHADSLTWSAKVDRFEPDGSFYVFSNDLIRGFDVFRFDSKAPVHGQGKWLSADVALDVVGDAPAAITLSQEKQSRLYCLLGPR